MKSIREKKWLECVALKEEGEILGRDSYSSFPPNQDFSLEES